ncbi:hypothetical protein WDW37_00285 [Bdellovibrionota bacterium FG-1]
MTHKISSPFRGSPFRLFVFLLLIWSTTGIAHATDPGPASKPGHCLDSIASNLPIPINRDAATVRKPGLPIRSLNPSPPEILPPAVKTFASDGRKIYQVRASEHILKDGSKIQLPGNHFEGLKPGETMQSRLEGVLQGQGILQPGQTLEPLMVKNSLGDWKQAGAGNRIVFKHPTLKGKWIKLFYHGGEEPAQVAALIQRHIGFKEYAAHFFKEEGVVFEPEDYSLTAFGATVEDDAPSRTTLGDYLAAKKKAGKRTEVAALKERIQAIQLKLDQIKPEITQIHLNEYGIALHKGNEEIGFDLGKTKFSIKERYNPLDSCWVLEIPGQPPQIRCHDI